MTEALDGVILAAGRSSRMQQPKPLLPVGGSTFLERGIALLRAAGCRTIWVVVPPDVPAAEAAGDDVTLLVNEDPQSQQVDSLRLVVERLPDDTRGILVLPVDVPLVSTDTAKRLADAFRQKPGPLFLPFHNTVAGHPVLLGRELFQELLETPLKEGVRSLIMKHARTMVEVKVIDPGILIDIDTPDDYWRYIEQK